MSPARTPPGPYNPNEPYHNPALATHLGRVVVLPLSKPSVLIRFSDAEHQPQRHQHQRHEDQYKYRPGEACFGALMARAVDREVESSFTGRARGACGSFQADTCPVSP